jgi:RNA polymerase sigma-70 factor (ECF subfamily)
MEDISSLSADKEITDEDSNSFSIKRSEKEIAEIYDRHINTVYRVCFSIMGNSHDAEDAAQSVFLKMMKSNPSFSDTEHEKAWLIITAQNCCRDLHRQWWKKNTVVIDSSVEASTENIIGNSDILKKLLRLSHKQRVVLYLHYYEGYKLTEIASILKLNGNTVKSQIRSAKKRLKLELGDDFNE